MSDASVSFRHVWKKFRYGEVHNSLRDLLPALGRRLIRRASRDDRRDLQSRLGGLAPGDRVVLHPSDRVKDGVKVVGR